MPFDALAYVFGRDDSYWYRLYQSLGRLSIIETTVKDPASMPLHFVADEKHIWVPHNSDSGGWHPLLSLETTLKAKLIQEYGAGVPESPLNIVAIVDGARSIRCRLESLFGASVPLILDWYHLSRKVRRLMGMIAEDREQKHLHLREVLPLLWCGQVFKAIEYQRTQVQARSPDALEQLLIYLENHESEMIDYRCRKQAGKTIGSGRVEKGVDIVVGHRQKNKGMSWSEKGSRGLAILKVVELNGQWKQLWFADTQAEISIPG